MTLARTDQRELLGVLHAAATEGPAGISAFLERVRRRVGAASALLIERRAHGEWLERRADAAHLPPAPAPEHRLLLNLRPERLYTLAEAAPEAVGAGRIIRSRSSSGDQWLVALNAEDRFDAADGTLMSDLAPHIAIACETAARLEEARADLALARIALARAGVGWALMDRGGHVIAGDTPPTGQPRAAFADTAEGRNGVVAGGLISVRPPPDEQRGAALALFRTGRVPDDAVPAFAASHSVPPSEARLAVALALGDSIEQAAARLGLSLETARYYSKRLYAATGARGQADLVRLFWQGIAALA
ncbi:hypothetical protein FJQ54_06895 [Sandaracinobacter neustonicus]|uniref:HTH luxR-type domain-containing protein n=1 Tax=Sandaracinobacter neustonicus TaxID=1715348 RepID=A0A501XP54_9SPHN|nr:hypothetical protein [Sandaracinobacter neustonicus]TPE62249.1 hypothetical protein FJQ54_06895 [Sandaracinobacter neustonicus]